MPAFWDRKNFISYALLSLAAIYRVAIAVRKLLYRTKLKEITKFDVPVIVVGNITVGGTGKTPLVIWLANFLKHQGFKPGIVSRGYGGKAHHYPYLVNATSNPKIVGDESLLLVRNTQCPMMIDPNRVQAVKKLLQTTDCNIILSDDGLQHYKLGRDIEIVVIDGARRFGNKFCLPAGPLREPIQRLNRVDFIICNGQPLKNEIGMQLVPNKFCHVNNKIAVQSIEYFKNKKIHAVAGIGNPKRFFNTLRALSLNIVEHAFPDHYPFQAIDFQFAEDAIILMTEKDAVKCEHFATDNMWYLPVNAQLPEYFKNQFLSKLNERFSQ